MKYQHNASDDSLTTPPPPQFGQLRRQPQRRIPQTPLVPADRQNGCTGPDILWSKQKPKY